MTAHNQDSEGGSHQFTDEMIRRFLLGCLSASEQPLFEQRLFADDGLEARVRLIEFDLADDYAYGRLSGVERELFEQKFLVSTDRLRKVEVSRVLRDRFASVADRKENGAFTLRARSFFAFTRPAWRFAFAGSILLILMATAWLVIKEPRIARQITNRLVPRRLPAQSAPREASHPTNTSVPEHQSTPSPMPVHDQPAAPPEVTTISLAPAESPPNEIPSFNLPKGDQDVVRLQLSIKPDQTGPYRVELVTIEGSSVYRGDSVQVGSEARIDFDVPARSLRTGSYQIKVGRGNDGSRESIATYYFRLQ